MERHALNFRWQAKTHEPVDQVIREQQNVKTCFVGSEVFRRNLCQGIITLELFDNEFHGGSAVVKLPCVEGRQLQVRHNDLVAVLPECEQRELLR